MEYFIPVKPYSLLLLNYPTCEILVLNSTGHVEPHIKESNHIRDFVFGFGDGINSSLGIVAGVGGANSSADFIILVALVGMFTGAKAMAVQNYLALKSQREILESEIKREEYEMEAYPEKEFLIGAKKAKLAKKNWVKGGIEMSALGTGIALLGNGIGAELDNANLLNY